MQSENLKNMPHSISDPQSKDAVPTSVGPYPKKEKKKKKGSSAVYGVLSPYLFHFTPSRVHFPLSFFYIFYIFFLASFFLISQQKFQGGKSMGGTVPPCTNLLPPPHLLCHCSIIFGLKWNLSFIKANTAADLLTCTEGHMSQELH